MIRSHRLSPTSVYHPFALILLAFGIVYALSLSFVYVDGDDASSIAFHALGRNRSLQPPYAAYHGMMDTVLRVVPAAEPALRITAITISSVAAVGLVTLMLLLVFDWLGPLSGEHRLLAAAAILIGSPEFYYFGLIYMPSLIAMCFALAAHLLMRGVLPRDGMPPPRTASFVARVSVSLLLFGLGVACRWDIGPYGFVIVADLLIGRRGAARGQLSVRPWRAILAVSWGVLAVAATLGAIVLSGYGVGDLSRVSGDTRSVITAAASVFSAATLGRFQTLFTPGFVLLAVIGYIGLARRRKGLAVIGAAGILSALPFMYSGIPKMILPAIPGMLLAVVHGLHVVWFAPIARRRLAIARLLAAAAMVAPWIVGMRVYSPDTAWGPGFEISLARGGAADEGGGPIIVDRRATDRELAVTKVKLTLEGGFAVPTQEGPRPLGGHAAVLLGGRWRKLALQLDREREGAVRRAIAAGAPMLQDDGTALLIIQLIQMGFVTNDAKDQFMPSGIARRRCYNGRGEEVTIYRLYQPSELWDAGQLDNLTSISKARIFVLYCRYSSVIRRLVETAPGAVELLGPFSAVLDIHRLREAVLRSKSARANTRS